MIYVSTTSIINNKDLFNVLGRYNKLGIRNIELGSVHNYISNFSALFKFQKDNDINFIIHSFFPPSKKPFFINLSSQNKKNLKKSIEFSKNAIEMCRKLNSDFYSTHSGFNKEIVFDKNYTNSIKIISEKYEDTIILETLKKSITEICDYANNYNIKIAIETMHHGNNATIMNNPAIFIIFFKNIKLKNLGLLYDVGHMEANSFILKFDFKESIEKLKKKIITLHLNMNMNEKDDHLPIKDTKVLDLFGKDFLKNKYLTLEGQRNWTEQNILDSKKLVENYLS